MDFRTLFPARKTKLVLFFFPFSVPRSLITLRRKTLWSEKENSILLLPTGGRPHAFCCAQSACVEARLLKAAGLQPPYLQVAQVGDVSPAAHVGVYAFNVYNSHWPCVVIR